MTASDPQAVVDFARSENAMGYREAAAFLIGRAATYDGPAQGVVYAFAYKVHEELMEQAKRIDAAT